MDINSKTGELLWILRTLNNALKLN